MSRTQQIRDAALDMMKKVSRSEEHIYTRATDGKFMAGVSTISSVLPKEWLAAWGAKEAVKFLGYSDDKDYTRAQEVKDQIAKMSVTKYHELLHEAKGASRRKSKEALVDGTAGHAWLEDYVKARIRGTTLPPVPEDNLKRAIEQFLAWEEGNVKEWVLSEARVCDPEEEYAGTLDAVAKLKDEAYAVIDFKFANKIGGDYYLQLTGYAAPFAKYGINFEHRVIIRLPKTEMRQVYDRKTRQYNSVPNDIEVCYVDTPFDFDLRTFLAARTVWKWINFIENR